MTNQRVAFHQMPDGTNPSFLRELRFKPFLRGEILEFAVQLRSTATITSAAKVMVTQTI